MSPPQPRAPRFGTLALDQVMDALGRWSDERQPAISFAPGQSSFNVWKVLQAQPPALPVERVVRYGDLGGSAVLRERISQGLNRRFGTAITPGQVCITNGGSEAIMLALHALMQPGDALLMARSCYPGYRPLHRFFGARRIELPMAPDRNIDVQAVHGLAAGAGQALLVNSPSNPFGSVLSQPQLDRLAALPMPIVFDEVYQPLSLHGSPVASAMAHTDRHFVVGSFAKSLAVPGLRLGYLISPPQWAEEIINIKALLSVCSSSAAQFVMESLLEDWDALEEEHRAHLRRCHDHFMQVCRHLGLALVTQPHAGLFAAVALKPDAPVDSLGVALELAHRHGLGVVPSADFQDEGEPFLRLNFSIPHEQIEPGLTRLARALRVLGAL